MEYIAHPDHKILLQKELDKWNPIIQKLACEEFETMETGREFVGYLYHCLRDQPKYSVQRRSIQDIKIECDEYYEKISQRIRIREARENERRKKLERRKRILSWGPHKTIQPRLIKINRKTLVENRFQIIELRNEVELEREGRMLKHCVGTYSQRCKNGSCSIWSLRRMKDGNFVRAVTIQVSRDRRIVQMRGILNRTPDKEDRKVIVEWAKREQISGVYF